MPDDIPARSHRTDNDNVYDTIVIGAGISGLACANRLQQQLPGHRIKVLEARDRIGGRIASVYRKGCKLDTGANWIHGTGTNDRPNPLMGILPNKRYRQLRGGVMFRPPGEDKELLLVPKEFAGMIAEATWGMIGDLHEAAQSVPLEEARKTTLLEAVQRSEVFLNAFAELAEKYHSTLRGLPQFIENMEAGPLVPSSGEGSKEGEAPIGLLEFAINDFDGDQVFLQDGYTPIVEELAKPLEDARMVQLETKVEKVDMDSSQAPVKVSTNRGEFLAGRVVVTIPLGVLKECSSSLFAQLLPDRKQQAIKRLGFGTLDKTFLVYSQPWWNEEPYHSFFQTGQRLSANQTNNPRDENSIDSFMGFTHALPGLSISPSQPAESGPTMLSFINLHALTGQPVLGIFTSCANAVTVERMTDDEAGQLAHDTFCSWLPSHLPAPPKQQAVYVTRWAQDEWSKGSYSHMIANVSEIWNRTEFETPLEGKAGGQVRFAGEHTSEEHFATAHGALLSGWREADAIIEASKASTV